MKPGPVFQIIPRAGLGNRMLQYLAALQFQAQAPACRIAGVSLPEWGIRHPAASPAVAATVADHALADLDKLAARVRRGTVRQVDYTANGMWLPHLPDVDTSRAVFSSPHGAPVAFDDRHVVCPLGVGDPLNGAGLNLPLLPVEFYAGIIAETGRRPVFVGQTGANDYTNRLRARFPQAVFLPTDSPMRDFATIQAAKHIILGVSVLAWLAAWLSHAERIDLPVLGVFNPMQFKHARLLPFGDPRYRFHLFPIHHAVPLHQQAEAHHRIMPAVRLVPHGLLQRQFAQAPRFDPPMSRMLEALDIAFYMRENPDVAETKAKGDVAKARKHYQWPGSFERRLPFALQEPWYAATYPRAAIEVAQGDYTTFAQHYIAVGRARGYSPRPDPAEGLSTWEILQARELLVDSPSIAALAEETIALEMPQPLDEHVTSRLGKGFRKLPRAVSDVFTYRRATEQVNLYRLRDVVLDAATMTVFSAGEPIPETFYMGTVGDYEHAMVKPIVLESGDPGCHYIIGGNRETGGYYHWMTQSLPAIDWGLRQRRHKKVALALPPLQPWQEQTLLWLGHAKVPRLTLNRGAHYRLASAEHAEFLGIRFAGIVSQRAAETYARLRQAVPPAGDGAAAIYVARTDSRRRVVSNEADLIAMLEQRGVRTVVPGSLSVAQQIATFRAARLVIGAHGGGLSNVIGCGPGAHLYELVPSHYANFCYDRLAQCCGMHYWADMFPAAPGKAGAHDQSWRIDVKLVAARLEEILATMEADDGQ